MKHIWIRLVFLPLLLVVLPLAGVMLQGMPLVVYMEFPPMTVYVQHAPFSWVAFLLLGLLPVSVLALLIRQRRFSPNTHSPGGDMLVSCWPPFPGCWPGPGSNGLSPFSLIPFSPCGWVSS
jgi:hypothetical protein